MLHPEVFNDDDVKGIVAHEIGHLLHWDTYRYWKIASTDSRKNIELKADKEGGKLAGCKLMQELFRRHYKEALAGWNNRDDPHPHPEERIAALSTCE